MATKKKTGKKQLLTQAELDLNADLEAAVKADDKDKAKAIRAQLKRLAFRRLAPKRVRKALGAIGNVEQLGAYPSEKDEADKIVAALRAAVDKVADAFRPSAKKAGADFDL